MRAFITDESGATAMEWALLAGLLALIWISVFGAPAGQGPHVSGRLTAGR